VRRPALNRLRRGTARPSRARRLVRRLRSSPPIDPTALLARRLAEHHPERRDPPGAL